MRKIETVLLWLYVAAIIPILAIYIFVGMGAEQLSARFRRGKDIILRGHRQ